MKKVTISVVIALSFTASALAQAPAAGTKMPYSASHAGTSAEQKLAKLTPKERKQFEAHAKALGLDPRALAGHDLAAAQKLVEEKRQTLGPPPGLGQPTTLPLPKQGPQGAAELRSQALAQNGAASQDLLKQQQQMIQQINDLLRKMNDAQDQALQNTTGGK